MVGRALGRTAHHRLEIGLGQDLALRILDCGDDAWIAVELLLHRLLHQELLVDQPLEHLLLGLLLLRLGDLAHTRERLD